MQELAAGINKTAVTNKTIADKRTDTPEETNTAEGKHKMTIWLIFFIYIALSATGLFLIKLGTANTAIGLSGSGIVNFTLSFKLIIGLVVYICSFLLSLYVISQMNLTVYYIVTTGSILTLTTLFGYFILKEHIGLPQIIGIALVMAGIVLMNIKR